MKDVDDKMLEKLPDDLRAELRGVKVFPRKHEKEILEILKKESEGLSLNYILSKLWIDYKKELKRPALTNTLKRLAEDGKIVKDPAEGYTLAGRTGRKK